MQMKSKIQMVLERLETYVARESEIRFHQKQLRDRRNRFAAWRKSFVGGINAVAHLERYCIQNSCVSVAEHELVVDRIGDAMPLLLRTMELECDVQIAELNFELRQIEHRVSKMTEMFDLFETERCA